MKKLSVLFLGMAGAVALLQPAMAVPDYVRLALTQFNGGHLVFMAQVTKPAVIQTREIHALPGDAYWGACFVSATTTNVYTIRPNPIAVSYDGIPHAPVLWIRRAEPLPVSHTVTFTFLIGPQAKGKKFQEQWCIVNKAN